jgi:hypothetical protein
VSHTKTEQFTRIGTKKLLTLEEAAKTKTKEKKPEPNTNQRPMPTSTFVPKPVVAPESKELIVTILSHNDAIVIDDLYRLANEYRGEKRLVLKIESSDSLVNIPTNCFVSDSMLIALKELKAQKEA